jgi:hypothetical protein
MKPKVPLERMLKGWQVMSNPGRVNAWVKAEMR